MDKHILVIIHGIKTPLKSNWQKNWKEMFNRTDKSIDVRVYKYGYIFGVVAWIMAVTRFLKIPSYFRHKYIGGFERYLIKLQIDNPQAEVSIMSHSFGTWITYYAINRLAIKNYKIKFRNIIFIAGVISSHAEKLQLQEWLRIRWIKNIYAWSSNGDKVVKNSALPPFGKLGCRGFIRRNHKEDRESPALKPYDEDIHNIFQRNKGHSYFINKIGITAKPIYQQVIS